MALNRLGVPRKTHLPSNKPLGKLSTYVKAFTLSVPEPRCDAVIGKRFGFNHVKHGIKHLCESGKQLMELTTKQLVYPECNSGSNSSINSSLSKKQPNHHIRHTNTNHRRLAPASLTDQQKVHRKTVGTSSNANGVKCNTEQCLKRKKSNNGNRSGGNQTNNKKNVKKSNAKSIKTKLSKKVQVTTTTTTTTTTESAILNGPTAGLESNVPDSYEDEFDYPSGSVHVASNGQTGLSSDEDYEDDK